jgi:hypothetical protein
MRRHPRSTTSPDRPTSDRPPINSICIECTRPAVVEVGVVRSLRGDRAILACRGCAPKYQVA